MNAKLDNSRYTRDLKNYVEEIVSHLIHLPNAEDSIHVDIKVSIPEGVTPDIKNIVEANCLYFKIDTDHFHFR